MRKVTTSEFIAKARAIHGDKYDYSKVVYINNSTKVCIICPEHGEFWQTPANHLRCKGCPSCGVISRSLKRSEEARGRFKKSATKLHKGFYGYSKVVYENNHAKVCITCPKHGEFWQTPSNHLCGKGCPKCSGNIPTRHSVDDIDVPTGTKAVPLTQGKHAIVDAEDYERVIQYNWRITKQGYAVNDSVGLMHRFIMNTPVSFLK